MSDLATLASAGVASIAVVASAVTVAINAARNTRNIADEERRQARRAAADLDLTAHILRHGRLIDSLGAPDLPSEKDVDTIWSGYKAEEDDIAARIALVASADVERLYETLTDVVGQVMVDATMLYAEYPGASDEQIAAEKRANRTTFNERRGRYRKATEALRGQMRLELHAERA